MNGQVDCGAFRWKTTLYGPATLVLFRLLISDEGVLPPACLTTLLLVTRSNENLTSADVMGVPSENLTFLRRVHVHVFRFAEGLQPVVSTGSSLAPCGKP